MTAWSPRRLAVGAAALLLAAACAPRPAPAGGDPAPVAQGSGAASSGTASSGTATSPAGQPAAGGATTGAASGASGSAGQAGGVSFPNPSGVPSTGAMDSVSITLERTACFGRCPVYTVTLNSSGRVAWHGERFVAAMGDSVGRVSPGEVRSLGRQMDLAGFFGFHDRYTMDEPAAQPCHTDAPHAVISLSLNGRSKRVEQDYGCRGAPEVLRQVAARIDSVANTARWVGPR